MFRIAFLALILTLTLPAFAQVVQAEEPTQGFHADTFVQTMNDWVTACTKEGLAITKVSEGTLKINGEEVPFYAYKGQWNGVDHLGIAIAAVPDEKSLRKFAAIGKVPHQGECHVYPSQRLASKEKVFVDEEKEVFTLLIIEAPLPDKKAEKKLLAKTLETLKKSGAIE